MQRLEIDVQKLVQTMIRHGLRVCFMHPYAYCRITYSSCSLLEVCAYCILFLIQIVKYTNIIFVSTLGFDRTSCVVSGSRFQRTHPMSMSPRSRSSNVHHREEQRVPLRPRHLRERLASTNRDLILTSGALSTHDDLIFRSRVLLSLLGLN